MAATRLTGEEIRAAVEELRREPFRELLLDALSNSPSPQALKIFADKAPDRYAQCLTQYAKLAGYNEKIDVEHTVTFKNMSDMELITLLNQALIRLQEIDITPTDNQTSLQPVKQLDSK